MRAKSTILSAALLVGAVAVAGSEATASGAVVSGKKTTVADAVVTYRRPPPTFGAPEIETARNHGSLFRIDSREQLGKTSEFWNVQAFSRPGQLSSFKISRRDDGSLASLSVRRDELAEIPALKAANFTGATEAHLGEKCRVWRISHKMKRGYEFVQSGCLTSDGVSLWFRGVNQKRVLARKIVRKRVSPAEVRVPTELLNIRSWVKNSGNESHASDYEVILGPSGSSIGIEPDAARRHVERRSGSWIYSADGSEESPTHIRLENPDEGIGLSYSARFNSMNISRQPTRRSAPEELGGKVLAVHRADNVILGETCRWWDMTPGLNDAGQFNCITKDGITLKIELTSMGRNVAPFEATSIRRSPQPLAAVLPAKQITSPAAWGF